MMLFTALGVAWDESQREGVAIGRRGLDICSGAVPAPRLSNVRVHVQNRLLRKAGWSWYEVECRSRPKPFDGGPHHDREEA